PPLPDRGPPRRPRTVAGPTPGTVVAGDGAGPGGRRRFAQRLGAAARPGGGAVRRAGAIERGPPRGDRAAPPRGAGLGRGGAAAGADRGRRAHAVDAGAEAVAPPHRRAAVTAERGGDDAHAEREGGGGRGAGAGGVPGGRGGR